MTKVSPAVLIASVILSACLCASPTRGQQIAAYPAFTVTGEVIDYDDKGNHILARTETRYSSASGDWRYKGEYPGGHVVETIFRTGEGVYFVDNKNKQLIKVGNVASGQPRYPATAESLRADPRFTRTEYVLGLLAYVHRQKIAGYLMETYFAPELGPFPLKRVSVFSNGYKRVEEPVGITFGEPEASLVKGADYPIIEEKPIFSDKLDSRIEMKPAPVYPPEAQALGIKGSVTLQIIVDGTGRVISARVISIPLPGLEEAALDAAYKVHFSTIKSADNPTLVTGVIKFDFPPRM